MMPKMDPPITPMTARTIRTFFAIRKAGEEVQDDEESELFFEPLETEVPESALTADRSDPFAVSLVISELSWMDSAEDSGLFSEEFPESAVSEVVFAALGTYP